MFVINLAILSAKQVWRHPIRSGLTMAGVAIGMFLFTAVEAMQATLKDATETKAGDTTLIVYRENRFCPFTSQLPERYQTEIAKIPGVASVTPFKIVVNNCGASLDVVTFRGLPTDQFADFTRSKFEISAGNLNDWNKRSDSAFIGKTLADRRGLNLGDRFDAAGITVSIAGIMDTEHAMDRNAAYVHLDFLQQNSRGGLGTVTQFNVQVRDHLELESVAQQIDALFANDQDPTHTRPEKSFVAQTAKDLVSLIGFTRWVGLGAVLAVLALVTNTVLLAIRSRVTEHAILQTLGYSDAALVIMVLLEGMFFGLGGSLLGVGSASLVLYWGSYNISNEGISLVFLPTFQIMYHGLILGILLGIIASFIPAWQAIRSSIVGNLRMN